MKLLQNLDLVFFIIMKSGLTLFCQIKSCFLNDKLDFRCFVR